MPLDPSPLLAELAASDDPPTALDSYLARLRQAGAIEVYVARQTPSGAWIDASTVEQARSSANWLMARGRRVVASSPIDWAAPSRTPVRDALDRLVDEFH